MYVCICHALNDKQVSQALDNGARTPASVFRHFECQVQCGKCVPTMRAMAQDHCGNHHSGHTAAHAAVCQGKAPVQPLPEPANAPANADVYAYGVAAE
jgi:Bacterioferritin-associated ferredoxin